MKIAVIDGQGGGIGKAVIEKLRQTLGKDLYILALGTNAVAASFMKKAGADDAAAGENPIVVNCDRMDYIIGPVGIIVANSMLGELTPQMALAISKSRAEKLLIPQNRCGINVVGAKNESMSYFIEETVRLLGQKLTDTEKD